MFIYAIPIITAFRNGRRARYGNNRVVKIANNIVKTFTATGPGSYTATVTSLCGSVMSNALTIVASKTPVILISADSRFACPGETVAFTATTSYGGLQPVYQWTKNGIDVGANADTYMDNTIADGDAITCSLLSNDRCLITPNATANVITMSKARPPDLGPDITLCPGTQAGLNARSGYAAYTWQDGSTDSIFTATEPGLYYVKVTDFCQDPFSDTVSVFFYDVNTHFLPADTSMCSFDQLVLRPSALFSQYTWSNGAAGPAIMVDAPGLYWLQVVDAHLCSSRDSVLVGLKDACPAQGVYVPGAFSPNRDGKNDVFRPLVYGSIKSYHFSVYNRYGQVVFTTKEPGRGWDGEVNGNLPDAGVFVWYCTFQFNGGTLHTEKGTVMLIR
jgi:gliding motility-associated-like protein